jgi:hypothetical protein
MLAWWRRRRLASKVALGVLGGFIGLTVLAGLIGSPPDSIQDPTATPTPAAILEITTPVDGSVVSTPSVQVRGSAPPGAEIVQDISFAPDRRTGADAGGRWTLTVDLEPGVNDLVFRLGSDNSTAVALRVIYIAATPTPSPSQPSPTIVPTVVPSPGLSTIAVIDDAADDLKDVDGAPTSGPRYADIVQVSIKSEGDDWLLSIFAREDIVWKDPYLENLWYGFWLDIDGDGEPEYTVSMENGSRQNEWFGDLFSVDEAFTYAEDKFPGVALPVGTSAVIRLRSEAIRNPELLSAAATIERQLWADPANDPLNVAETFDDAPDTQYPDDGAEWMRVLRQ